MMKLHGLVLLLAALASAGGFACSNPQGEDLDNFCKAVNEVNRDSNLPTAESKIAKITERSPEYTKAGSSGAKLWSDVAAAANDKKYGILIDGAKAIGKNDYQCRGYEKLLATMSVEDEAKKRALEEKPDAGVAPDPPKPPPEETAKATSSKKDKKHSKKKKKRH
jgi:hypothetical protein